MRDKEGNASTYQDMMILWYVQWRGNDARKAKSQNRYSMPSLK